MYRYMFAITSWDMSWQKLDNKGTSRDQHKCHPFFVAGETAENGTVSWLKQESQEGKATGRGWKVLCLRTMSGGHLMRNRSHIRPRSPDIPQIHASFLQHNSVLSGTSDRNTPSKRENSVISGPKQLAENSQRMILSWNHKGSIKQTNTSQVLVSETGPDKRVQPSREAKKTRFQDNHLSSTVAIPPRRQSGSDTSTRIRRKFKLDVIDPDLLIPLN